ncbi:C40 family peptidase [Luteibacter sp. UNC138MFCol5.1]|uniref:C40 family peptidase n=1 Tax=Luteibacter sp. UNC138MFCol5.1 TaxID=1502774 RepID=UPI000AFE92BF|nr:C40 family peptidase [Luteibacter sp. UNC138MFCol5.1]
MIEPTGYEAPLVGRTWAHGVLDCWALCRDWYARERGVLLPDPPRADGWWDDGASDLYGDDAMREAGFRRIDLRDITEGDLILMQIRSKNLVPNHAAIYLGDSLILHHLDGRLSSRDVYGGYWQEVTRSVWRLV